MYSFAGLGKDDVRSQG